MTKSTSDGSNASPVKGLEKIRRLLTTVFLNSEKHLRKQYDKCNKIHIEEKQAEYTGRIWRVLSFWCLSPGLQ